MREEIPPLLTTGAGIVKSPAGNLQRLERMREREREREGETLRGLLGWDLYLIKMRVGTG